MFNKIYLFPMQSLLLFFYFFSLFTLLCSLPFQPCVLDTINPGADIADNAVSFPDPFAWYTNPAYPSVTLPGPELKKKCGWTVGSNFQWTREKNSCLLNGQGYPLEGSPSCNNDIYATSKADFIQISNKFIQASQQKAKMVNNDDGSVAHVGHFNYQGNAIEAAMSIGHGVLSGLCGNCFLIKLQNKYVFQLQTDVRAWSLELSGGANVWISNDNYGGTCHIPEVMAVDCEEMMSSMN